MTYKSIGAILIGLAMIVLPSSVSAEEATGKGLSVTPLRQEMTIDAGKNTSASYLVGNQTDKPMTVTLSVKQFSVEDYSYNYVFSDPKNDWVKFQTTTVQIPPHETKRVGYTVTVPPKATPGGYYFSLFASTQVPGAGVSATVQAASLLYVKVAGKLVQTGVLLNDSLPFIVTGDRIPYKFDVKDTGNVYFGAYFYGQVEDLLGLFKQPETGTSHLLMPGAVRTIDGAVPAPILPGLYKVTYGYKVDFASIVVTKSAYILFIPPWSIAALVFLVLLLRWLWQKRRGGTKETIR